MKSLHIFAVVISVLVFVPGCHTARNEAELFRQKYPERAKHYYVLEPQSVHFLIDTMHMHRQTILGLMDGVERRKDKPEELEQYLRRQRDMYSGANVLSDFEVMKAIVEEIGGTLYYFRWRFREFNATYEDEGFMIIRDGEVIYRNGELAREVEKSYNQGNAPRKHSPQRCVPAKASTSQAQ